MQAKNNLLHYDNKYTTESLNLPPEFAKEFLYSVHTFSPLYRELGTACKILDLGGGTGEFSKALQDIGFDVTCFDYSSVAVEKAAMLGVKTICADFTQYTFEPEYELVVARGFSCFNTDSLESLNSGLERTKHALKPGGKILYMGHTDLSGSWTKSNWYCFSPAELDAQFGPGNYVLFLKPLYQTRLPHIINQQLTRIFCLLGSKRLRRFVHVCAHTS